MLDYHPGIDIAGAERTVLDVDAFVAGWKDVLSSVLEAVPDARGRLLVDLVNEPDAFALTWSSQGGHLSIKSPSPDPKGMLASTPLPGGTARPSLDSLYVAALDALFPMCPECIFLVEGGGQASVAGVHWGNGFVSDASFATKMGIQTPIAFFEKALESPWLKQLAIAPHIYCPRVSGAADCYKGECLFESLDRSFGALTRGRGFCSSSSSSSSSTKKENACHVFAAVIGELGSTLADEKESSCMSSVVDWVTASGEAASPTRVPYRSFFWWAWNPDSEDTGEFSSIF